MKLAYRSMSLTSPTKIFTRKDLETAGFISCSGNRMVDTSFLNLFFKLVQFATIEYQCKNWDNRIIVMKTPITVDPSCLAIRDYFANVTSTRPSCNCFDTANEIGCNEVEDELMSSTSVTVNERVYKDVMVLKDGSRFSMDDEQPECFQGGENFKMYLVYVK